MQEHGFPHAPATPILHMEHGFPIAPRIPRFMQEQQLKQSPKIPILTGEHVFNNGLQIEPKTPILHQFPEKQEHGFPIAPKQPRFKQETQFAHEVPRLHTDRQSAIGRQQFIPEQQLQYARQSEQVKKLP